MITNSPGRVPAVPGSNLSLPLRHKFSHYALLPVAVILLIIIGWYIVLAEAQSLIKTVTVAYQETELEIVQSTARSVAAYVRDQTEKPGFTNPTELEQEIFRQFIDPIRLLERGDAWIYAPDHVVYDSSADFPDEYRDKNMVEIFAIQAHRGASHYQDMTEAVMQAREGVGWYIWLPDKGPEVAAWTPVRAGNYTWTIGLSTPLRDVLAATGATRQTQVLATTMTVGTVIALILLCTWGYGTVQHWRTSQALQASEDRYRQLVDHSPDLITVCRSGQIHFINETGVKLAGAANSGQLIGKSISDLLGSTSQVTVETWLRLLEQKQPLPPIEHKLVRLDGTKLDVEIIGVPWSSPRETGIQLIIRNITKRKRAEEGLRQYTIELDARNKELDAFAHTVAHDLKSPLALTIGFAEYLEQNCPNLSVSDIQETLHKIIQNGQKLNAIIEELMLLTGVRQQQVIPQPLAMGKVVAEAIQRLTNLIQEQEAQISLPGEAEWPAVLGYGPWIEEVWANYLSNAIKYGGRPPRVELGAAAPVAGQVRFWVRDNGPGLSPEDQAQLFIPFTRLDQVHIKGHGLGLSIVRRIVEKLGGEVGVESEPGQGSTFFFTLPLQTKEILEGGLSSPHPA